MREGGYKNGVLGADGGSGGWWKGGLIGGSRGGAGYAGRGFRVLMGGSGC